MNLQTLQRGSETPSIAPSLSDSINIIDHIIQHVRDLSLIYGRLSWMISVLSRRSDGM